MTTRPVDLLPKISFKVEPHIRDAIRKAADAENRSMNNWVHTALLEVLTRRGYKNDLRKPK